MSSATVSNIEHYFKEEDSIEVLDDLKQESVCESKQIVFENDTAKCGEVLVGYQGDFTFICVMCKQHFIELSSFGSHIKDLHLNLDALNPISIENDFVADPPCEETSIISVSPQGESNPIPQSPVSTNCPSPSSSSPIQTKPEPLTLDTVESSDGNLKKENLVDEVSNYEESSSNATKVEEFICGYCGRSYQARSSYRRHIKQNHSKGMPDQIICKYCYKEFEDLKQLETHVSTHTGPKRYVCPLCPRLFNSNQTRQSHINVHNGERPYKCSYCPRTFADAYTCDKHKRDHPEVANKSESETESSPPISIPDPIRKGPEVIIVDTVDSSDYKDNESSTDDVSNCADSTPVAISCNSTQTGEFGCPICGRSYQALGSYRRHMRKQHPNGVPDQIICKFCHKKFEDMIKLEAHIRTHTERKRYVCQFCPKVFISNYNRQVHTKVHTGRHPYKCLHCPKTFAESANWEKHQDEHLQAKNESESKSKIVASDTVASSNCDDSKGFSDDVSNCEKISSTSTKVQEFICAQCGRRYSTRNAYTGHVKRKHPEVNRKLEDERICQYCDKEFDDAGQLKVHLATHTGRRRFVCPFCPKLFADRKVRQFHINTHTGDRPYKCSFCPKAFSHPTNLLKHEHAHLKIMKYSCDYCDRRFVQLSSKKVHERTHTGEKPFQCEECGERFISHVRMTEHCKRHKNIKPNVCPVCNRAFYNSNLLKDHMPIHTKERPYHCKICGKSYPRKKSLRSHLQLHSNNKKYVCNICGEAFLQSTGLYSHRKLHGNNLV